MTPPDSTNQNLDPPSSQASFSYGSIPFDRESLAKLSPLKLDTKSKRLIAHMDNCSILIPHKKEICTQKSNLEKVRETILGIEKHRLNQGLPCNKTIIRVGSFNDAYGQAKNLFGDFTLNHPSKKISLKNKLTVFLCEQTLENPYVFDDMIQIVSSENNSETEIVGLIIPLEPLQ